ncbi:hypothetical protein, partial [Nocardia wallacei]|uniref:hypothetical protein n=1 Tax=Nocardia wallacei TaxID=480035 RepID=UPI002454CBE0
PRPGVVGRGPGPPKLPPARVIPVTRRYVYPPPARAPPSAGPAAALAAYGRLTVEHNDLFPGHVFATGGYLFDWGDAVITHPFLSARTLADPHREDYFDAWRAVSTVTAAEIALAERLAPLTALYPFLGFDTSPGAPAGHFAPFVAELVDQLRDNFA